MGAPEPADLALDLESALARVNLLRMRREYEAARELCLSVLNKHPQQSTALALMGDIFAEQQHLDSAVHWYELALTCDPTLLSEREKVQHLKQAIEHRETVRQAQRLGLPTSGTKLQIFAWGVLAALLAAGLAGFYFGDQSRRRSPAHQVIEVPVINVASPSPTEPVTPVTPGRVSQDEDIRASLLRDRAFQDHLLAVWVDARGPTVWLALRAEAGDEAEARSWFELAKLALPSETRFGIRLVREQETLFMTEFSTSPPEGPDPTQPVQEQGNNPQDNEGETSGNPESTTNP